MKFRYFPETDTLYVEFRSDPAIETVAVTDSVLVDLDNSGRTIGIDLYKASEHLDLSALDEDSLPFQWLTEERPVVPAETGTWH